MEKPTATGPILLVDDEKDIRDVLEISLADCGYDVCMAENGDAGLRVFKEMQPSIVLADIKMPVMDGIELLRKIKHENPETEVIMITGHGDMDLAIESLKNEATDFITKPINVDALEISLRRAHEKIMVRKKLREYTENLERLIREKTELQDHLSSLGLMIGTISHGIKGLLTGLDGGMYLLDTGFSKQDQKQVKEGWDIIKRMVEKIRKMVLDILFYAKKRDLKWDQVDVLKFADEVAAVVEPKMHKHGVEFVREFDPAVGRLEIDAGVVHSALINILENAADACAKDKSKKEHRVEFGIKEEKKAIAFTVSDNGIGMDSETLSKIFTLFFSSKGEEGTGLGLFISHKIIEQHGGTISVNSKPGRGSEFIVRIPKVIPENIKYPSKNKQ